MRDEKIKVVAIVGPTGSGKTELAVRIAEKIGGEIINADSMQVYRGMDIGTAKPSAEQLARVPHHLLSCVPPSVNFTAADFRREAALLIEEFVARGKRPVIAGGTGLYIRALLEGLVESPTGDPGFRKSVESVRSNDLWQQLARVDSNSASRLHPNDRVRIIRALEVFHQTGRPASILRSEHGFSDTAYETLKIGIFVERPELYRRLDRRVDAMVEAGIEEEVRRLLSAGYFPDLKPMRSIGYKEVCAYLAGHIPFAEAVRGIKRDTRHYAKRQITWFKRDKEIYWLEYPESFATILEHVIAFFA